MAISKPARNSRVAQLAAGPFGPRINRLALVTDAWKPQTNGVVNTLVRLVKHLELEGMEVMVVAPDAHFTVPLPSYPEIRIACDPWKAFGRIRGFAPDAVHVATEGPLGFSTIAWLRFKKLRFTTSFHTRYPEYLSARVPVVPVDWGYDLVRWFHGQGRAHAGELDVAAARARGEARRAAAGALAARRRRRRVQPDAPARRRLRRAPGPDLALRRAGGDREEPGGLPQASLPGTKVVVGDGPSREELQRKYPEVVWRGYQFGAALSAHFASADCFVFPSRTETFGNVILEAFASGLPVASVPAPGPVDLITEGVNGAIDDDLARRLRARAPLLARPRARQRRPADAAGGARPLPRAPRPPAAGGSVHRSAPGRGGLRGRCQPCGSRSSGRPIRMTVPCSTPGASSNPSGAKTMIVEPSSNHPISSPFSYGASQAMARGPSYARCKGTSRKRKRMLATRIDATGTRVTS